MAQLYTLPVYNLNRYASRFYFESVGKRRNSTISVRDPNSSYSVSAGSCMDISPGSEKLTAGSLEPIPIEKFLGYPPSQAAILLTQEMQNVLESRRNQEIAGA